MHFAEMLPIEMSGIKPAVPEDRGQMVGDHLCKYRGCLHKPKEKRKVAQSVPQRQMQVAGGWEKCQSSLLVVPM